MQQRKARKAPAKALTANKFHSILRAVRKTADTGKTFTQIANDQGVSMATVAAVKRAGSWKQFQENKKAVRAKRRPIEAKTHVARKQRVGVDMAAPYGDRTVETRTVYVALTVEEHRALMSLVTDVTKMKTELGYQAIDVKTANRKLDILIDDSRSRRRGLFGRR